MEKLINREIEEKYQVELARFADQKSKIRRLWNVDKTSAYLLYSYIIALQPQNILEIGTSNGFSTFWLSIAAENYAGKIETIEVDEVRYQLAMQNLANRNNITNYFGLAENIIPQLSNEYDFVFIDAGKIGYINYIKLLLDNNLLNKKATVIADNVVSHQHTTQDYIDFIEQSEDFTSIIVPLDSGMMIAKYNKRR